MSDEETEKELRELVSSAREIAAKRGPQHAWWDAIFEVEAFLAGKPAILEKSGPEWVEYIRGLLEQQKAGQRS